MVDARMGRGPITLDRPRPSKFAGTLTYPWALGGPGGLLPRASRVWPSLQGVGFAHSVYSDSAPLTYSQGVVFITLPTWPSRIHPLSLSVWPPKLSPCFQFGVWLPRLCPLLPLWGVAF